VNWKYLAGGILFLGAAGGLEAQTLRDFAYSRPLGRERQLKAIIEFAAGKATVGTAERGRLYELDLRYDAEQFEPVGSYDAGSATVRLGVKGRERGGIRVGKKALPQNAVIGLPAGLPLELEASLGAAEAELELGGLALTALKLESGASSTVVRFSEPNPGRCSGATLETGAGSLRAERLGNSGCTQWQVESGVGSVVLDLAGSWPADATIDLQLAVGGATIQAPRGLGLRIRMSGFLADFAGSGFGKDGKTYTSTGYESAERKVELEISSALGGVKVEWK
jgi:hypothetical protein